MNEFIEKNRRLLKIYCVVARIIGWVLLIVLAIGFAWVVLRTIRPYNQNRVMLLAWLGAIINIGLLGFIALGVAAFIRYLFETECHLGWTLRHAEGILYTGAVLIVAAVILRCVFFINTVGESRHIDIRIFTLLMLTVPDAAKILILIGLGKILRHLMPVIEESKSLV